MATAQLNKPVINQALLFMPDISGFTKFVNETEIIHSQHIIQELLEILIDSNQIELQVNEIEGDAIFFYKPGERPSIDTLIRQAETMYINFHKHLQLYDHRRICNCGACQSAINLKLKIIIHYGEVSRYAVKEHKKLFGKDVIVIHRLLKNSIGHEEYLLMTEPLVSGQNLDLHSSWFSANRGKEIYDAGEIEFCFSILSELGNQLPPPEFQRTQLSAGTVISFTEEDILEANMNNVFGVLFDLGKRTEWMAGVKAVEMMNHEKINRVGTQHLCIVDPKNNPLIVTESAILQKDKIEMVEMNSNGAGGCRYCLHQLNPSQTQVRIEVLINRNPVVRLMFNLLMKGKFRKRIRRSLTNLAVYCKPVLGSEN